METLTMIAFGFLLAVWMYGFSALLFRRPHSGRPSHTSQV
jgi:hypothetical protein